MFGEECTLPMDVGLPRRDQDLPDPIKFPMRSGSGTHWRLPMIRSAAMLVKQFGDKNTCMTKELSSVCLLLVTGL